MKKSDFYYPLPDALIAQAPPTVRSAGRLLYLDRQGLPIDRMFGDLPDLLKPGDLLVLNDTRVIPARLYGRKSSGGRVEILVERILDAHTALAHIRASKSPKPDSILSLDGEFSCRVLAREADLFVLAFCDGVTVDEVLTAVGHIPLPPYITRSDSEEDQQRYQTVFAKVAGAIAAPTAGLHFDENLMSYLTEMGVELAYITLHVGSGTFLPVRVDDLDQHVMHAEICDVSEATVERIRATQQRGGRVVAVGTTVVRALETASVSGEIRPYYGETRLFIRPGFEFHTVDALITNFHLPESTLLTLVCAFAGYYRVMDAYRHAVAQAYRFFSYGDAMFLIRQSAAETTGGPHE
ncbi:MAG: tRNA preQ1(34) S-adenosylmethionine ribosyltransferase-isomerase QueA [Methylococcaceae bacterium]|jgi:S-adenosylmethionine:tRNA ribosyltransferase-isomerase